MIGYDDGTTYPDQYSETLDKVQIAQNDQNRQNTIDTVTQTLTDAGASQYTIDAFKYNIGKESSWNPDLRHTDQHDPRWKGTEAEFAHGLLSEGGPEWEPMYKYAVKVGTSWNDPKTQINYAIDNLKSRGIWDKMNAAGSKEEAASMMLTDYLRPAKRYQDERLREIGAGGMNQYPLGTGSVKGSMPYLHVTPNNYPEHKDAVIDRDHDVPLLAGGLMNNDGITYGTAIDRNIAHFHTIDGVTFPTDRFVHSHEMAEIADMEGRTLQSEGSSAAAYTKSHNEVATPKELEEVKQFAQAHGKDPEKFAASYQQFWADNLKNIKDKVPEKVHSDLYLHPYDGHQHQALMEKLSNRTIAEHPSAMTEGKVEDIARTYPYEISIGRMPESTNIEDRTNQPSAVPKKGESLSSMFYIPDSKVQDKFLQESSQYENLRTQAGFHDIDYATDLARRGPNIDYSVYGTKDLIQFENDLRELGFKHLKAK